MDLEQILLSLSRKRPIFHSEADFQHALAWEIQQHDPDAAIRLEYKPKGMESRIYLDIWTVTGTRKIAIELKYKTKKMDIEHAAEVFQLSEHSAQDCGRYDFLKDIQRLEQVASLDGETEGYAIFLTNDSSYWNDRQSDSTVDQAFRLPEGRILTGEMAWGAEASDGTMRGRETPISLQGFYPVEWRPYSALEHARGQFRYLIMKVEAIPRKSAFDLEDVLAKLANKKPFFLSQADLRDSLIEVLSHDGISCIPNAFIDENMKADIRIDTGDGHLYAMEVRYKTANLFVQANGRQIELKKQGAQDISRYDYVQDVVKLERAVEKSSNLTGYAILVTNDHLYWDEPKRVGTVDEHFRVHEGAVLHGRLHWSHDAGSGTTVNREEPLIVKGPYTLSWKHYSMPDPGKNGTFKVLVVKVQK